MIFWKEIVTVLILRLFWFFFFRWCVVELLGKIFYLCNWLLEKLMKLLHNIFTIYSLHIIYHNYYYYHYYIHNYNYIIIIFVIIIIIYYYILSIIMYYILYIIIIIIIIIIILYHNYITIYCIFTIYSQYIIHNILYINRY